MATKKSDTQELTFNNFKSSVLRDYKLACESREMSLIGRREVLSGKGSFGIFGDGKELAQIALSRCFKKGDFRSGYYRDQTLMMALGEKIVLIEIILGYGMLISHLPISCGYILIIMAII